MLTAACPILPSRELDATAAFHAQLGFRVVRLYAAEGYLILAQDGVELHFFHQPGLAPERSDHGAYLRVADVDAWTVARDLAALPRQGIPRFRPAEDTSYGLREAAIVDPDGNLLRIGSKRATTA